MSLQQIDSEIKLLINNSKNGNQIIDAEIISGLFQKYDVGKVWFCLRNNLDIQIEYGYEDEEIDDTKYNEKIGNVIIRDDYTYKNMVKQRFNKCIICNPGECNIHCCNVAHIWDFKDCDENSKYNPDNGLLMCSNIHKLFDDGLIILEPCNGATLHGMVKIKVSSKLSNTIYQKYNEQIITIFPDNIPFLMKKNKTD